MIMSIDVWRIWMKILERSVDGEDHLGVILHKDDHNYLIGIIIIIKISIIIIVAIIIISIVIMITSTISSGKAKTGAPIFRPQLIAYFAFARFS